MNPSQWNAAFLNLVRWAARLWSALIFAVVVLTLSVPDPNYARPLPPGETAELAFIGLTLVGLILAWRWQSLGGWLALAGLAGHILVYRLYRGGFFGREVILLIFGLPAVLFLIEGWLKRERQAQRANAAG